MLFRPRGRHHPLAPSTSDRCNAQQTYQDPAHLRNGVGYDNVDVTAAAAAGIAVSNVPDYGTEEVADHALALILALVRQFKPLMSDVAKGNWEWRTGLDCCCP